MKKKLAIFSVSAGAGHIRAAEAVKAQAAESYPQVEVVHIDLMSIVGDFFKKIYADSYLKIVEKHPSLWGYIYRKADRQDADSTMHKFRRLIEKLNTKKFMTLICEMNPDIILCTHFLPAELLSRKKCNDGFPTPVWVQVTDFDIHGMWLHENIDGYFTATDEVAYRMAERKIPSEKITVTGIPVMPAFTRPCERKLCAQELGLDPAKVTLLLMSGGYGIGQIDLLAERLMKIDSDFQLLALGGRNEELVTKLKALGEKYPKRLVPFGMVPAMERLMSASDLAITKPGGLTTSECMATGLPMLVTSPIPGQEERNADYLMENGAALKAYDPAGCEYRVRKLLKNPALLKQMKTNILKIARPEAAKSVLDTLLKD